MTERIRRSPALLAVLAVVIIGAIAFGWWTISPLFIRTSLSEGQDITLPAMAVSKSPTPDKAMAAPQEKMAGTVIATGNFDRKDEVHYATGQAIVARQADGSTIVRLQDLDSANGPDLFVWVSEHPNPSNRDELHQGGHDLGGLKATNGSFDYALDPSIDPANIKSVVIYCRAFSVIFSVAQLQAQ